MDTLVHDIISQQNNIYGVIITVIIFIFGLLGIIIPLFYYKENNKNMNRIALDTFTKEKEVLSKEIQSSLKDKIQELEKKHKTLEANTFKIFGAILKKDDKHYPALEYLLKAASIYIEQKKLKLANTCLIEFIEILNKVKDDNFEEEYRKYKFDFQIFKNRIKALPPEYLESKNEIIELLRRYL